MLIAMKGLMLTKDQVKELREAHKDAKKRSAREAYKINAVILLGTGWTYRQVEEALLIDDEALRDYAKRYREGGIEELLKSQYKGRSSQLNDDQQKELCEELDGEIYLNTAQIIEFVERKFKVKYTCSGMRDLLHRLGYVFKKPKLVPGNPNQELQEIFANQYEEYMIEKPDDVEMLFMDAVHPEHNTLAAYGWIKKGTVRKLKTNSGRQRINLHGAINIETLDVTIIESATVDSDSTVTLLETIEKKYPLASEILIILDNAKYHYSKAVKEFLEKSKKIRLIYLPAYSPELNLIERLWKFFKKKVLYNRYYENVQDFRKAAINFFSNISQHEKELRSILSGGFDIAY